MADVTERMLRLLATLQAGRAFAGEELAARLGVSPRTLRRDVERLRAYGYPVSTRPGPGGHYQLTAGQRMPPLVLDDDEAVATVAGLALLGATTSPRPGSLSDAAQRAYGKIDAVLPPRLQPRAVALRVAVEPEPLPTPDIEAKTLTALAEAMTAREVVTFTYVDAHGAQSRRRGEPHRHVHLGSRWYLLCWDLGRDDWRVFRTDRVTDLAATGRRFELRALPGDSAVALLRTGLGEEHPIMQITIDAPAPAVADALRYDNPLLEQLDEDRTRATVSLGSWERLLPGLARLGVDFHMEVSEQSSREMRLFARRLEDSVAAAPGRPGSARSSQ
jgi:predicted DNA-binding transcriptional regulator YafY